MFKLSIPITKSFQKGGKFFVEGIASDPTIDRDEEKFDEKALDKMVASVNDGSLPIRMEHEDKVYTDVGTWIKAGVDKDNKMYVKGEIDTEMSLGKDIQVLLKRGTPLSLSVGGRVIDAIYEFVEELGKNIKIYKDVILEEISIVKNPSNYNTSLSMAKSINWEKSKDKIEYTTNAQKLIKLYKDMEKVDPIKFEEVDKEVKSSKNFDSWYKQVEPKIDELFKYIEVEIEECDDGYRGITPEDMKLISQMTKILNEVDLPDDNTWPSAFDDDNYWSNLTEEMQIVLYGRDMVMPHHNTDFSVNKELLLYQLKQVMDGMGWYKPKDFSAIVNHLYIHLKKLQIVKSNNMPEEKLDNMSDIKKHIDESGLSKPQLDLLQSCHNFTTGKSKVTPINEGKEMTKEEIAKSYEAYEELLKSPNFNYIINHSETMDKKVTSKDEVKKEEEEAVEETPKEEVETTEETPAEEVTEEAPEKEEEAEAPAEEEKEETPVEDAPKEEAPEVEEEAEEVVEEVVEEVPAEEEPAKEEVVEEAPVEDAEVEKALTKSVTAQVEKSVVAKFDKSLKKLTDIVDSIVAKSEADKTADEVVSLRKDMAKIAETLNVMAKASLGRKSYATTQVVEKSFQEGALDKTAQEAIQDKMEKGQTFTDAYKEVLAARSA